MPRSTSLKRAQDKYLAKTVAKTIRWRTDDPELAKLESLAEEHGGTKAAIRHLLKHAPAKD